MAKLLSWFFCSPAKDGYSVGKACRKLTNEKRSKKGGRGEEGKADNRLCEIASHETKGSRRKAAETSYCARASVEMNVLIALALRKVFVADMRH